MRMFSFCVVLPAYNEQDNIGKCIERINDFLKTINHTTAILVVNDGSIDSTSEVLMKLQKEYENLLVVEHPSNKGYGAANKSGILKAKELGYEYVLFMDADLTQSVHYIYPFLGEMSRGIDFIKATRYSRGGSTQGVSFFRVFVSWVGNFLARILLRLPLTDYTNGFRAAKTDLLVQLDCKENGFAYLVEEVNQVSRIAKSYSEVPYILTIRETNASKSKFRFNFSVYKNYLKYLFR